MTDRTDFADDGDDETGVTSIRIEGFEQFRRIGSGGFSSVYSALETRMGRPVAIKVLHADVSSTTDRQLFERECQAMGLLSRHPNIVTVYGAASTSDGLACLVMELYDGNYRERLDRAGALPMDELLVVGVKIAGALQAAHDTGVLHRDIKPHNIFLSDFDEPSLGDFGISTLEDERSVTGAAALSVAYSAPEVIEDGHADFLSDVYSLCASLYHLAEGVSPFAAPQVGGVIKRILDDDPAPLARIDAPGALDELVRSGLSKNPAGRPESAGDVARSLQDIQVGLGHPVTVVPLRISDRHERAGDRSSGLDRAITQVDGGGAADDAEATLLPDGREDRATRSPSVAPPEDPMSAAPDEQQQATVPEPEMTSPTVRRSRDGFVPASPSDPVPEVHPGSMSDSPWWSSPWAGAALVVTIVALAAFAVVGLL